MQKHLLLRYKNRGTVIDILDYENVFFARSLFFLYVTHAFAVINVSIALALLFAGVMSVIMMLPSIPPVYKKKKKEGGVGGGGESENKKGEKGGGRESENKKGWVSTKKKSTKEES